MPDPRMTPTESHLLDVVAPAANLREGVQLIDQDTVLRQARHVNGRTREVLPRVEGTTLHELLALGFEPDLSDDGTDPLLAPMFLPEGWQRVPTDHHMYSHLVDPAGANRVLIMFKGGDWDRDAWMRVL